MWHQNRMRTQSLPKSACQAVYCNALRLKIESLARLGHGRRTSLTLIEVVLKIAKNGSRSTPPKCSSRAVEPSVEAIPGKKRPVSSLAAWARSRGFCRPPSMQFCGPLCAHLQTLRSFSGLLLLLYQCAALVVQATPPLRHTKSSAKWCEAPAARSAPASACRATTRGASAARRRRAAARGASTPTP